SLDFSRNAHCRASLESGLHVRLRLTPPIIRMARTVSTSFYRDRYSLSNKLRDTFALLLSRRPHIWARCHLGRAELKMRGIWCPARHDYRRRVLRDNLGID